MNEPILLDYPPVTLGRRITRLQRALPFAARQYLSSLFPIFQWITRYSASWLFQDIIAGVTVGIVHVPQGIAYAKIANLPPQYGLYTAFVGSCMYCFFGTSKDISVGPITVVSLLVGRAVTTVTNAHHDITGPEIAMCLSLFTGVATFAIGMIRLGVLVDFIPGPAIAGYMTGSAVTISLGQWGKLTGINIDTHKAPYLVLGSFLKNISNVRVDIAFGLVGLTALYVIKYICTHLGQGSPKLKRCLFYVGIMRSGIVLIIGTLISFLINMHRTESTFSIIKTVPAGFDAMGVPSLNTTILGTISDLLPSILIIMILEHVSVAKAFGRMSDYSISADQEIIAIGICNVVGAFFGAYPGTGAFSRTAIMARSGAKSPMASVFGAAVIVLALYVLTPAFYYIPEAILAAVVIHAVSDLVAGPRYIKELWNASILEFTIFVAAVLIIFFVDVETGIYAAVGMALFLLFLCIARPSLTLLARVPLDRLDDNELVKPVQNYAYVPESDPCFQQRIVPVPSGILVFRFSSALLYPNAAYVAEKMISIVKARTRRGETEERKHQALWNQPVHDHLEDANLPLLEALVLDFTSVSRIDSTALQMLVSVRGSLERYAGQVVEWHFAGIQHLQVRQDLVLFGFGSLRRQDTKSSGESDTDETVIQTPTPPFSNHTAKDQQPKDATSMYVRSDGASHQRSDVDMVHPYYVENNKQLPSLPNVYHPTHDNPYYGLPKDRYPCFHWDVDFAVHSICARWQR